MENIHKRRQNNGVVDNIKKEIDTTFTVNLLSKYLEMKHVINLTKEERDGILKYIIYLMEDEQGGR